jgi:hypothetical protein
VTSAAAPSPAALLPFLRAFLREYTRNPVNLLLLAIVPSVFVAVIGSTLADAAALLGGTGGPAVETATAGWAAGFLAGIAMYSRSLPRETSTAAWSLPDCPRGGLQRPGF